MHDDDWKNTKKTLTILKNTDNTENYWKNNEKHWETLKTLEKH